MLIIIYDSDKDAVYISIKESTTGKNITHHMWTKYGVFPHWDGSGELLGIEFTNVAIKGGINLKEVTALQFDIQSNTNLLKGALNAYNS